MVGLKRLCLAQSVKKAVSALCHSKRFHSVFRMRTKHSTVSGMHFKMPESTLRCKPVRTSVMGITASNK